MPESQGPLAGLRIVEIGGIGPAAFAAMLLADMGAEVIRVERPAERQPDSPILDPQHRGKRLIMADLKQAGARDAVRNLIDGADVLLEGFRPGVLERLGLGPEECLASNPRLVYGRMTGWGQHGPLAHAASHDPNNLSIVGALHAIGRKGGPPQLPLALVGDFGGGALYLVSGVLAALFERQRSGRGQVVDAAIVDGVAHMMSSVYGAFAEGRWVDERGSNLTDTGTPFVDTYETSDGKYMAVAALEPQFYAELILGLELDPAQLPGQWERARWDELRRSLADAFRGRSRDEWAAVFAAADSCVTPVLSLTEAPHHPHLAARRTFIERNGRIEPGLAPRFSRTSVETPTEPVTESSLDDLVAEWRSES